MPIASRYWPRHSTQKKKKSNVGGIKPRDHREIRVSPAKYARWRARVRSELNPPRTSHTMKKFLSAIARKSRPGGKPSRKTFVATDTQLEKFFYFKTFGVNARGA